MPDASSFSVHNVSIVTRIRFTFGFLACLMFALPARGGHTLTLQEQKILAAWLAQHWQFRAAKETDCDCSDDIKQMKAGDGGIWSPVPDYQPYRATGDFNNDGNSDFAVVVIDRTKPAHQFMLLVFNGPFGSDAVAPAFIESGLDLKYMGLFFGPPRPKPYRLLVGRFESDTSSVLVPHGPTYKLR